MQEYWSEIYRAWDSTLATEQLIRPLEASQERNSKLFVQRMRFARLQFDLMEAYMAMVHAANTQADYPSAVAHGKRGLEIREQLTQMNPTFTTYKKIGESGYAWWPGEVQQYQELVPWTDGSKGTRIANLPLVWSFRTDPANQGIEQRTDLYAQAQGIVTEDYQSYTGHLWYDTQIELTSEQIQGQVHLRFPGIFNECWLYVDGVEVGYRPFKGLWWLNDYRFEWDVDLTAKLKPGMNRLTVRLYNPHHFGGMFRRPFLYRVTK